MARLRSRFAGVAVVAALAAGLAAPACLPGPGLCDDWQQKGVDHLTTVTCSADGAAVISRVATRCDDRTGPNWQTTTTPCETGKVCLTDMCVALAAAGEACSPSEPCMTGLVCVSVTPDAASPTSDAAAADAQDDAASDVAPRSTSDAAAAGSVCQPVP